MLFHLQNIQTYANEDNKLTSIIEELNEFRNQVRNQALTLDSKVTSVYFLLYALK